MLEVWMLMTWFLQFQLQLYCQNHHQELWANWISDEMKRKEPQKVVNMCYLPINNTVSPWKLYLEVHTLHILDLACHNFLSCHHRLVLTSPCLSALTNGRHTLPHRTSYRMAAAALYTSKSPSTSRPHAVTHSSTVGSTWVLCEIGHKEPDTSQVELSMVHWTEAQSVWPPLVIPLQT